MRKQQTIKQTLAWEGIGIHTGAPVTMRLLPAPPDTGIIFSCMQKHIPATIYNISSATRNSNLSAEGITIHTVEHILAALYGMEIDNAVIELSAPEPPAMDGSALPFAAGIREAGISKQEQNVKILSLTRRIVIEEGEQKIAAQPHPGFRITYVMNYPDIQSMKQVFDVEVTPDKFIKEIAPARTFALAQEVESLIASGLARGGSLENAVVISQNGTSTPLRFPEEPARHKVLDIIGDFALLGVGLRTHIIAVRSGHKQNHNILRKIAEYQTHSP